MTYTEMLQSVQHMNREKLTVKNILTISTYIKRFLRKFNNYMLQEDRGQKIMSSDHYFNFHYTGFNYSP